MRYRFLLSLCLITTGITVHAQTTDSLSLAKQLMAKGQYKKAASVLSVLNTNYPGKLNTQWLYGQALFSLGQYQKSQAVYEDGIAWHPENYYLRLDYALKLMAAGYTEKAYPILDLYLKYDSMATDVHAALAQLAFWEANYAGANKEIDKVLQKDPSNTTVKQLQHTINKATAPWIRIGGAYNKDDQPLSYITPSMEAGMYLSKIGFLDLSYRALLFNKDDTSFSGHLIKACITIPFNKGKDKIALHGGAAVLPDNSIQFIGDLDYSKKIGHIVTAGLHIAHEPYLLTRSNLDNPFMQIHYNLSLDYFDRHHWEGKLYADVNQFYKDSNHVFTIGGWIYSKPFSVAVISARVGYAFSYADAKRNQFVSSNKGAAAVTEWINTSKLNGYYNNYFTPSGQMIHSLLASVIVIAGEKNELGCKANVGVYAQTKSPYLVLTDVNGNNSVQYYDKSFTPFDLNVYWLSHFSDKLSLMAEYKYMSTNFYASHYAGLSLTIHFLHAR